MCNGEFMSKEPDDALKFLDQIAKKTHQWKGLNPLESIDRSKPSTSSSSKGIYQLREEDELTVKYDNLAKEEMKGIYEEQCATIGSYQRSYTHFSETYNPATRNHPNLHWRNDSYPQVNAPNHQFSTLNSFQRKQSYADPVQALGQKLIHCLVNLLRKTKK
ncbi:hypothetical protein ACFX2J_013004 [Malus domestica]